MEKETICPACVFGGKAPLNKAAEAFTLVKGGPEDFEQTVRHTAQMTGIARASIYQAHESGKLLKRIYAYSRMGMGEYAEDLTSLLGERIVYSWFKDEPESGNIVSYSQDDEDGMSEEVQEAFVFCVPIYRRGSFWGIVTLENMSRQRFDTDSDQALRELAGVFVEAYMRANNKDERSDDASPD